MTPRIRKFVVAAAATGALLTAPMPYALASAECHTSGHDGRSSLGEGTHHVFLPNGVSPLGCVPGSVTRPCQGGN
ncbi:hypothetical protein [Nocardia jejuensis]|uniref:hypothetical protein n=1 Tax=Nocardia jejuensis TaxID=328049 RepID=UPI0008374252|nr:hypothetical protein [Nocardia jejuensis]